MPSRALPHYPQKLRFTALLAVTYWFVHCSLTLAAEALGPAPDRLPRTNLMVFRTAQNHLAPVRSQADWEKRRAEIISGMEAIMGPLPGGQKRCPLDVQIQSETDGGSYLCRLISYAAERGSRVPAYLLIPKAALAAKHRFPAVLALHPTDDQFGQRVTVEAVVPRYRAYGRDLAERGFVVLAPAYPLLANYQPDLDALGYQSGTMKAIWDNIRGLDLLVSLPFVDAHRVGAIGHSLGGHNAIFTAVFDQRIKAVVSSCGFDSFCDYMDGNLQGWTSRRYMPRLKPFQGRQGDIPFDFPELLAALAPRALFINAPLRDTNFKWRSVDEVVSAAQPVYRLYGCPDNLQVRHPDCAHDFPPEVRQQAYQFLQQRLR